MSISKELLKEYYSALYTQQFSRSNIGLQRFKFEHPNEFRLITSMYAKRTKLQSLFRCFEWAKMPCYWFTLTFNNERDSVSIANKRKQAIRFIGRITDYWMIVEEYGEDNHRYHIHGFMFVQRYEEEYFSMFREWHSRQNIIKLDSAYSKKKRIKYLTNYAIKSVPRLRMSKKCIYVVKKYKQYKGLECLSTDLAKNEFSKNVLPYIIFDV